MFQTSVAVQMPKPASLPEGYSQDPLGSPGSNGEMEGGRPVLTEQWRKRWMGAREDEQIEIGPLIGRGGEHLSLMKTGPSCSRGQNLPLVAGHLKREREQFLQII